MLAEEGVLQTPPRGYGEDSDPPECSRGVFQQRRVTAHLERSPSNPRHMFAGVKRHSPAQPFPPESSWELQLRAPCFTAGSCCSHVPCGVSWQAVGICLVANFAGYEAMTCQGCCRLRMLSKSWAGAAATQKSSLPWISLPPASRRQPQGAQPLSSAILSHGLGLIGCSATWL